jgi:hypothetical protein
MHLCSNHPGEGRSRQSKASTTVQMHLDARTSRKRNKATVGKTVGINTVQTHLSTSHSEAEMRAMVGLKIFPDASGFHAIPKEEERKGWHSNLSNFELVALQSERVGRKCRNIFFAHQEFSLVCHYCYDCIFPNVGSLITN